MPRKPAHGPGRRRVRRAPTLSAIARAQRTALEPAEGQRDDVDRLPRTTGTSMPPATARYPRRPSCAPANVEHRTRRGREGPPRRDRVPVQHRTEVRARERHDGAGRRSAARARRTSSRAPPRRQDSRRAGSPRAATTRPSRPTPARRTAGSRPGRGPGPWSACRRQGRRCRSPRATLRTGSTGV